MAEATRTYDLAISFLAVDEPLALELSQTIASRMTSFVYSERQRELVGRDGMTEFSRVFERDSRIVAVLHRAGWGSTRWTRVEQTAIQERGFRSGWEFLVVVALDDSPLPEWLPRTRVWLHYSRFGIAGLAAVIEQRFQDAGGIPAIETAVQLAVRLRREQDAEAIRMHFLSMEEGVTAADAEVGVLFEEIQRIATDVSGTMSIITDRRGIEVVWLYRAGRTIEVQWYRPYSNTLNKSQMAVIQHRGRVGPGRYSNMTPTEEESVQMFDFNVDPAHVPFWEARESPKQRFSSRSFADEIVQQLLLGRTKS